MVLNNSSRIKGDFYVRFLENMKGKFLCITRRFNEARELEREDVDLSQCLLTVRQTKFTKSRIIPIHTSTQQVLQVYARQRDQIFPQPASSKFFLSDQGTCLKYSTVESLFLKLIRKIGLNKATGKAPTMHGLRHTFAVRTVMHWYSTGMNIERELPKLSTYLGHTHIRYTYWYLSAVPELLCLATLRLEQMKEKR